MGRSFNFLHLCVCLFVCCVLSAFDIKSLSLSLFEYSKLLKFEKGKWSYFCHFWPLSREILTTRYDGCGIFLGGDKNEMEISPIIHTNQFPVLGGSLLIIVRAIF